jgi:hypothetical protein
MCREARYTQQVLWMVGTVEERRGHAWGIQGRMSVPLQGLRSSLSARYGRPCHRRKLIRGPTSVSGRNVSATNIIAPPANAKNHP